MSDAQINFTIWIVIILSVMTYCKYVLGYSFSEVMKDAIREFKSLLKGDFSAESINAGVVVALIVIVLLYVFMNTGSRMVNGASSGKVMAPNFSELIVLCGMIGVFGIICVYVLRFNR